MDQEKEQDNKLHEIVELPCSNSYQKDQFFFKEFKINCDGNLIKRIITSGLPIYDCFKIYGGETLLVEGTIESSNFISVFRDSDEKQNKRRDFMNRKGFVDITFDTRLTEEDIKLYRRYIDNYPKDMFGFNSGEPHPDQEACQKIWELTLNETLIKDQLEEKFLEWSKFYKELKIVLQFKQDTNQRLYLSRQVV